MFNQKKFISTLLLSFSISSVVQADATLAYQLKLASGEQFEHTISISGRWLRLDSSARPDATYSLMDMGRMLMFEVDDNKRSYQLTRMGRLYWPATELTSPRFKPVAKKNAVNGIRCQPVQELGSDLNPVAEHCMAAGSSLGLNARETITLSRLFMSARRLGLSWPAVATADERQVSVLSQSGSGVTQQFVSVSHQRLDNNRFKIPASYKRLQPDLPLQNTAE